MKDHSRKTHIKPLHVFLAIVCLAVTPWTMSSVAADEPEDSVPVNRSVEPIITKEETIKALAGEKRRIRTDARILDVAVTRPEVADAFVSEAREILISANSPGIVKIVVQLEGGETIAFKIRVHVAVPERFADELRKKIGHIQGIDIDVVKGKILVDGRVLYLKDMDAIELAIGDNPSIINLTSLSSRNARILAREIERELRESGIYGARVEVRDNRVTLVGSLRSELLVKKAENIASAYTPDFDSHLKVVAEPPSKQDSPD